MKISIVVPIYNAEKTIERLIASVLIQTYEDYEMILVDDGSCDATYDIINKYRKDNVHIIRKANEGVGKARKDGFSMTTGDLVFFCDSDDYLFSEDVLERINYIFCKNDIDILMFDALDITNEKVTRVNAFSKDFAPDIHSVEELNDCFLFGPLFLKVFKRDKLNSSCFVEYNNFEDTYTTYKYLNNCANFYYKNEIFYVYDETANDNSLTKVKEIDKYIETIDLIVKMYDECKLKGLCSISAFNYYLYLASLIRKHINWNIEKVTLLKVKMIELEAIFLEKFSEIERTQRKDRISSYNDFKKNYFDKKLVIVDGISTVGKTTISQGIYDTLKYNNIKTKWLHEECCNASRFAFDISKNQVDDIRLVKDSMQTLYENWKDFYSRICKDDNVYIIDSNYFKIIHDFLLHSQLNKEEIVRYYNRLIDLFEKDDVLFVLLKRNNIKKSIIESFRYRGLFWEEHFKNSIKSHSSYLARKQSGEEILYQFEKDYQGIIEEIFQQYKVEKRMINTDEGNWNDYINMILNVYPLKQYVLDEEIYNYEKYIGTYSCEDWQVVIKYEKEEKSMFLTAFWPNIKLSYLGNDRFKVDKFPLEISFVENGLIFEGELVWEMKNKKFRRDNEMYATILYS